MTEQELQAYITELKRWEGHEPVAKKKFNENFFTVGLVGDVYLIHQGIQPFGGPDEHTIPR